MNLPDELVRVLGDMPVIGRNRARAEALSGELFVEARRLGEDEVVVKYRHRSGGAATTRMVWLAANRAGADVAPLGPARGVLSWQVTDERSRSSRAEQASGKGGATAPLASLTEFWGCEVKHRNGRR